MTLWNYIEKKENYMVKIIPFRYFFLLKIIKSLKGFWRMWCIRKGSGSGDLINSTSGFTSNLLGGPRKVIFPLWTSNFCFCCCCKVRVLGQIIYKAFFIYSLPHSIIQYSAQLKALLNSPLLLNKVLVPKYFLLLP